ASDEGVRNMLSAHINSLSETLAEKGIRVANVEITYAALADQPFGQRQPEQHKQKQSGNERAASVTNLHESAADWWDIDYDIPLYAETGLGLSSVEYRA
ncbi:MAG: hypothetical protein FWF04_05980, partial [Clostridiales bacterium]|nr:hypothetical protein [Clostridiales bacterium]